VTCPPSGPRTEHYDDRFEERPGKWWAPSSGNYPIVCRAHFRGQEPPTAPPRKATSLLVVALPAGVVPRETVVAEAWAGSAPVAFLRRRPMSAGGVRPKAPQCEESLGRSRTIRQQNLAVATERSYVSWVRRSISDREPSLSTTAKAANTASCPSPAPTSVPSGNATKGIWRHPQMCELPHVSSLVCDPFARRWDRYPHGAVLARTCRRINHNDLPARHEASRRWWPKPPSISHNNLTDDFVSWPMPMESTSRKGTSSRRTRAKSS